MNRQALALMDEGSALAEQLQQQVSLDDEEARIFREIARQRRPHRLLRQYEILKLWEDSGGETGYSTPRKPEEQATWPDSTGPVIAYFQAAANVVFGKAPSASQTKSIVIRYRHLRFAAVSWGGKMGGYIDDAKVFIIPAKKL
jgi:hypothetical protein